MSTTYILSDNYFLTEYRTATGRLQLSEGRSAAESKQGLLNMQRDLATYGRPAVVKQRDLGTFGLPAVQTEKALVGVFA